MNLIDTELTRSQFDAFDRDIVGMLCEATRSDLEEWSTRLLDSWTAGNEDAKQRARHSLKGLCGNYGADRLMAMADGSLAASEDRAQFRRCIEMTIAAVLAVAAERNRE